jgi:hypothetical protein
MASANAARATGPDSRDLGYEDLDEDVAPLSELRHRPFAGGASHALTLVHRVLVGHKEQLVQYLATIGADIRGTTDIQFGRLRSVHFLRWVVIDDPDDERASTLVLESNHDGLASEHLLELLEYGYLGLHRIYQHCEGYPTDFSDLTREDFPEVLEFLQDHTADCAAFHTAHHGKSAERIKLEAEVHAVIREFLEERPLSAGWVSASLSERYTALREAVAREGLLDLLETPIAAPPRKNRLALLAEGARTLAPLACVWFPAAVSLLYKEWHDPAVNGPPERRPSPANCASVGMQSQLAHLVDVKPGPFRRWILRTVLSTVDTVTRHESNQGSLGGVASIHFARWVLLDGGRRLLFFSNYDGSWDSCVGDFIDNAHAWLSAVWSNTAGFPKTTLLAFGGAADERGFKAWTQRHQVHTPLWYSAYPDLTVQDIQHNGQISAGLLQRPAGEAALCEWFSHV